MSEANPIVLVEELRKVLGRYIATTLPISRRYPRLAQRFRQELQQQKSLLPRVFAETTIGLPVVRQHFPVQPLLECLISAPADTGIVDKDLSRELASLVSQATPYAADAMAEGDRMAMWELQAGEDRDLPTIFRSSRVPT